MWCVYCNTNIFGGTSDISPQSISMEKRSTFYDISIPSAPIKALISSVSLTIKLTLVDGLAPPESYKDKLDIRATYNGDIVLSELLSKLKEKGYPLHGAVISYFSNLEGIYVYAGKDPIPNHLLIPKSLFDKDHQLVLKAAIIRCDTPHIPEENGKEEINVEEEDKVVHNKKHIRETEHTIEYVLCKVKEWQRAIMGTSIGAQTEEKVSLDEAAKEVDLPLKVLEDYLLQVRLGKKYGFDFTRKRLERLSVLRNYVKKKESGSLDVDELTKPLDIDEELPNVEVKLDGNNNNNDIEINVDKEENVNGTKKD